jgi:hypothetical protein
MLISILVVYILNISKENKTISNLNRLIFELEEDKSVLQEEKLALEEKLAEVQAAFETVIESNKKENISDTTNEVQTRKTELISQLGLSYENMLYSEIEAMDATDVFKANSIGQWANSSYRSQNQPDDLQLVKVALTDVKLGKEAEDQQVLLRANHKVTDPANFQIAYIEYAVALPEDITLIPDQSCIDLHTEVLYSSAYSGELKTYINDGLTDEEFIASTTSIAGGVSIGGYFFSVPKDCTEITVEIGSNSDSADKHAFFISTNE